MANPFSIHKSAEHGLSVLALEGYLDAHTAPVFEKAVETEFQAGHVQIVVECSRLTYISSAGLGRLYELYRGNQGRGRRYQDLRPGSQGLPGI